MGKVLVANRNLKIILKDAASYALSDWRNFLILGLILLLADHAMDLYSASTGNSVLDILILASIVGVVILLSFIEIGYGFRIVEETVEGSTRPPSFHHPLNLFVHGIKESLILIVYFMLPFLLVVLGLSELGDLLDFDSQWGMALLILGMLLFLVCFNILMQGAILTMAHHHGSLRWGFNMPQVFKKIRMVGLRNMFMVTIITGVVLYLIRQILFDALHEIPYLGSTVGELIGTVLIAPFLLIVTTRLLGLIDVQG